MVAVRMDTGDDGRFRNSDSVAVRMDTLGSSGTVTGVKAIQDKACWKKYGEGNVEKCAE